MFLVYKVLYTLQEHFLTVCIKSILVSWENTTEILWYENGQKCYKDFELAGGCECLDNWEQCPSDVINPLMELMSSPKCFDWGESVAGYCNRRVGKKLIFDKK